LLPPAATPGTIGLPLRTAAAKAVRQGFSGGDAASGGRGKISGSGEERLFTWVGNSPAADRRGGSDGGAVPRPPGTRQGPVVALLPLTTLAIIACRAGDWGVQATKEGVTYGKAFPARRLRDLPEAEALHAPRPARPGHPPGPERRHLHLLRPEVL